MIVTFCFVAAEIHSKYTFRFPFRLGHSQGRATLQGRVLTPNSAAPCPGSLDVTPLVVMYFDTYIYIIIYIVKGLCPLVLRVADVLNELVVLSAQPS